MIAPAISLLIIMLTFLITQVQIQFDIPKHDPLHDMKLELLQQYFVPPANDAKGLKCSVNSFTIKFALTLSFMFVLMNNSDNVL